MVRRIVLIASSLIVSAAALTSVRPLSAATVDCTTMGQTWCEYAMCPANLGHFCASTLPHNFQCTVDPASYCDKDTWACPDSSPDCIADPAECYNWFVQCLYDNP